MKKLLVILAAALGVGFVYLRQQEKKNAAEARLWAQANKLAAERRESATS